MTNTTMKKTLFINKKMALAFLAIFVACLFFVLFAGANTVQAATSANTAKESASTEKKLTLLEKMENEADEKTITVGKDDLRNELGVSSSQAALAKVNKTYAKNLLDGYGYENVSGNTYETQYPFSRIFIDGAVVGKESKITDEVSTIAVVESDITTLQYETPEEAALAAADYEVAGYDVYADDVAETEDDEKSGNSFDNYEYSMVRLDSDVGGDEEVIVAVLENGGVDIDTLLAYNNGEFADRIIYEEENGKNVYYDATADSTTATGGGNHGTEVASTILLNTSDNVKILPVKTSYQEDKNSDGVEESYTSTEYQQKAVYYAQASGADIVNMSYHINSDTENYCTVVGKNINTGIESGMTFVAAAGNDHEEISKFPACYEPCWTISAIDSSYEFVTVSSHGWGSNYGSNVDFCAPGIGITVLNNSGELDTNSGTSFASPLTSACIANLASLGGEYKTEDESCDDARYDYFETTCLDLGTDGKDDSYGCGMVQMGTIGISGATVSVSQYTYNGAAQEPTPYVKYNGRYLTEGVDYEVSYSNNTNAGTAKVTISGINAFTGTKTKTFTIPKLKMSIATITLSASSYTYNGTARKPSVKVKYQGNTISSSNYSVAYSDNTDAGTATVTITGKNNCCGSVDKTFTINQKSISSATVTIPYSSYSYTGSSIEPSFTAVITLNGSKVTLEEGTDYTVEYLNNTDAGTATIRLTGEGNFKGTKTQTFKIVRQYTLTYNSNYTSVVDQKDLTDSCTYTNPGSWSVPDASDFGFETPDGYEFLGWSTSDVYIYGGSVLKWAKFYEAGEVYDEDTLADLNGDILYAVWG